MHKQTHKHTGLKNPRGTMNGIALGDVYPDIVAWAAEEDRKVTDQVRMLLRRAVREHKKKVAEASRADG